MHFNLLLPSLIRADWERISTLLAPAVERDDQRQMADVERDLLNGDMALFDIDLPSMRGLVVIEYDERACLFLYAAGKINGNWRERIGNARMLMRFFEQMAKRLGHAEMRVEGRDWSRILSDYTNRGGPRHELVKAL